MYFDERTLGRCLRDNALQHPDRMAMEYAPAPSSYWCCTWKELDQVTDLLAVRFLRQHGIRRGMHVGIWGMNSPAFVQTYLALAKIGAVTCVFNTAYKINEMADTLRRSDTEVLFYEGGFRGALYDDMIPALRDQAPGVRKFVHLNEKEAGVWLSPDSFSAKEHSSEALDEFRRESETLSPHSVLNIIFTSGTTSLPKGVQLTHFGIVNVNIRMAKAMRWTQKDKAVVSVSMYHGFGLNAGVAASIVAGMAMHIIPGFRTQPVWDAIDKYECTVMLGVPSMYLALVRKEDYKDRLGMNLTSGLVGGSEIRLEEYREITAHFPNMRLIPSFGMTECSTAGSFSDWEDPCHGDRLTCGKFYENSYARIVDIQTGEVLCTNLMPGTEDPYLPASSVNAHWPGFAEGAEKQGELQFAGFNVFPGYYNMPEETAKAFTADGWFRSGDIGLFTKDGDFVISGRLKSLIIRSGENISPVEIEDAIRSSIKVDDVRVVGVPNDFTIEEIAACLILPEDAVFDAQKLLDVLREELSYFKLPKFFILFREFPMTASGKIRLGLLKEKAAQVTDGRNDFSVIDLRQV